MKNLRKAIFILVLITLGLAVLYVLFNELYWCSAYESDLEAFAMAMSDITSLLLVLTGLAVCIVYAIFYAISVHHDRLAEKETQHEQIT